LKSNQKLCSPGGRRCGGGGVLNHHPHLYPVEYVLLLHRAGPLPSRERVKRVNIINQSIIVWMSKAKSLLSSLYKREEFPSLAN